MADKQSQALAVVIAGMHRSGTSALSRTLSLIGCDLPKNLMAPDSRSNERGHWESQRVFELNNAILESAGSRWDEWETLNADWHDSPAFANHFDKARSLIEVEFSASPLYVVKDPRFCLLMGFWIKAIESTGATPLIVMPIRNPRDVAQSLMRRNGIDPSIGRLLWLRHVLEAEAGSRDHPRVTVRFDQLLEDWRSVAERIGERLGLSWPNLSTAAEIDIGEFLSPDLRHYADQRETVESPGQGVRWIGDAWEILQRWSIDEERPADLDALSEIRSNLNDLVPLFGRPLLLGRRAMHNESALEAKVAELSADLDGEKGRSQEKSVLIEALNAAAAKGRDEIGWRSDEMERLNQVIEALNAAVAKGRDEIGWRGDEVERLNQVVARQAQEAKRRDAALESLRVKSLRELQASKEVWQRQEESLSRAVNERDQHIAAILNSSSWRLTAPLRKAKLGLGWLWNKLLRLAQIAGWLGTGQLRKAAQSMLPFYRRHAPRWVGAIIPHRLRHWLRVASQPVSKRSRDSELVAVETPAASMFVPEFRGASAAESPVRLIAFYLPQFHPVPENDQWWGEGFTEWTNVRKAGPQFPGHYQPRVPIDMGYYDLRDVGVQRRQAEIARRYGIGGFCFYFYWFGGRRLLETPLINYVNDSSINFPFCLCWANENWTRRWDGREQDVLIGQEHSSEDDLSFIKHISRYLKDPRYIRVNDRPLLLVYRPALLPNAAETVARWRRWCRENGIGELFMAMVQSFQIHDPRPYSMDAAIEFPWHTGLPMEVTNQLVPSNSDFRGTVFDWNDYAEKCREHQDQPWLQMRGVMPGWDNTPRRNADAHLFQGNSPASYGRWLRSAMRWTLAQKRSPDERLLFINAWNEWGEGAYLEPDQRYGYAFLQATRDAVERLAEPGETAVATHPLYAAGAQTGKAALKSKQVAPVDARRRVAPEIIELQCPEQPEVSLVIPVYGNCHITRLCLASLAAISDERAFEVILVDDASPDESGDVLPAIPGVRYLRNETNLGFLRSCNRGAAEARGRYLLLLNNDTLVQDGAIDALATTFERFSDAGLVGAKLYFEDGSLQEAGGIVFSDGSAMNYGRTDDPRKPEYNYVRDADYCSGAAIMLPLALWRELGGFDEYYVRAYYEDTDLAFRVREAGYRVLYQPFAKVVHSEGATSGTDLSKGEKRYQAENRVRFLKRWQSTLEASHVAPGSPTELARDHAAKGRALVIDWAIPLPDHDSGSVDVVNLVRMLGRLRIKAVFASHRDLEYWGTHTDDMQQLGVEMLYAPYCQSLKSYLKHAGREFDYVLVHRVGVFKEWAPFLRTHCPNARIVFHTVDLHHIREARQAEREQSQKLRKQAELTRKTELQLAREADAVVVVSDHEKALLKEAVAETPVFHLPLIRDIPGAGSMGFEERRGIAFIGNYLHEPNLDAVRHFVQEIWPAFRAKVPGAELLLAGAQMPAEVQRLDAVAGVRAIGYVEDLAGLFNGIRLTVAPLRYGAGAKGKVVSSLCHGVPVVASPVAAEGMGLKDGRDILVARDKAEWAQHLEAAYCDETIWRELREDGLAAMRKRHTLEAGVEVLRDILDLNDHFPAVHREVRRTDAAP
ncbi:MAG: glycoside hydrolase family 99-like domain-containing protein [Gammaproteobacteria bacterium]|nr:glycoside hydrolase family 99-like domain-containing protein [Gammaproteobacteria bacterium]